MYGDCRGYFEDIGYQPRSTVILAGLINIPKEGNHYRFVSFRSFAYTGRAKFHGHFHAPCVKFMNKACQIGKFGREWSFESEWPIGIIQLNPKKAHNCIW